ncbi:MAG: ammonium transporter [Rhodothermales bacterium]
MYRTLILLIGAVFLGATGAYAQEAVPATEATDALSAEFVLWTLNNLWIMLAGALVFIMHLGFASLESGLTQSKNTVNILFKNTMIICIGLLTYALLGFNVMYPGDFNGWISFGAVSGFISIDPSDASAVAGNLTSAYNEGYTWYTDFFFQAMFAATAATIVSGAVAGRIKLSSFLIFVTFLVGLSYPITGSWKWGAGWLDELGFYDFAGSTLVHSVGGWAALVMAYLLGPRLGKYGKDGSVYAIPGSNLPLAAIGVFLLWFGWFGFNGGSVLTADAAAVSLVLVTTSMAAAAGGLAAGITSWMFDKKPDLSMALNGILAGLVGITAGADQMMVYEAIIIGLIAGVLVYFAVIFIDSKLKIDDPVGAISVHLICGIWGTLAVGIFGQLAGSEQLLHQLTGIGSIGLFTVLFTLLVAIPLKMFLGLRADEDDERMGLDQGEHDTDAYLIPNQKLVKTNEIGQLEPA